jgi:hypothetical protein
MIFILFYFIYYLFFAFTLIMGQTFIHSFIFSGSYIKWFLLYISESDISLKMLQLITTLIIMNNSNSFKKIFNIQNPECNVKYIIYIYSILSEDSVFFWTSFEVLLYCLKPNLELYLSKFIES